MLLRVLKFELTRMARQRLAQVAVLSCVLAVLAGGFLAYRGVSLTQGALDRSRVTGYTLLSMSVGYGFATALLFMLIHTSGSVAGERSGGTLKYDLTSGVRRAWFFTGKMLAETLLAFVLLTVVTLAAVAWGSVLADFGRVPGTPPIEAGAMWNRVARVLALGYGMTLFVVAATYLVSSIFRSATTVMGLSLGVITVGSIFGMQEDLDIGRFWPARYYLLAQKELFGTSQGYAMPELHWLPEAGFGLALAIVYAALLTGAALIVSTRRDIVGE